MSSNEIAAIKKKITDRGYPVPDVDDVELVWKHFLNENIITGPEMVQLILHIKNSAPTAKQSELFLSFISLK